MRDISHVKHSRSYSEMLVTGTQKFAYVRLAVGELMLTFLAYNEDSNGHAVLLNFSFL